MSGDWTNALRIGWASAKAVRLPAVILWGLASGLSLLYYFLPGFADCLEPVRRWQVSSGWFAVAVSRIFFNGIVPGVFILLVGSIRPRRPLYVIIAQALWGVALGLVCDGFFRLQSLWFGCEKDVVTLLAKTVVDQFVWTVGFIAPANALFYFWIERDFSLRRVVDTWPGRQFVSGYVLPNLVANWFVGIPAIFATYSFPLDLQIHVNGFISAFWMLMCLEINRRSVRDGAGLLR